MEADTAFEASLDPSSSIAAGRCACDDVGAPSPAPADLQGSVSKSAHLIRPTYDIDTRRARCSTRFSFKARRHAGRRSRERNRKRNAEPGCGMTPVAVVAFEGSACAGATLRRRQRTRRDHTLLYVWLRRIVAARQQRSLPTAGTCAIADRATTSEKLHSCATSQGRQR